MVILDAEAQYKTCTVHVIFGNVSAADEIIDVVPAVFYRKLRVSAYFICRHISVAGGYERAGIHIHRASSVLDLTGEKVVEAAIILLDIVAHVKSIGADEAVDAPYRTPCVHICADHGGKYRVCHDAACRPAEMLEIAAGKADSHFLRGHVSSPFSF